MYNKKGKCKFKDEENLEEGIACCNITGTGCVGKNNCDDFQEE